jgi:hypothetical protein
MDVQTALEHDVILQQMHKAALSRLECSQYL